MKTLKKELWSAMDQCRGQMEVTHLIELFSHVAFIAKESPEKFQHIVNSGLAKQFDALSEAGKFLTENFPPDICFAPDHYRVDAKALNIAITLMSMVTDFKLVSRYLRDFTKASGKMGSGLSSNQSMERLFAALIGDCSNKSIYDGACGLARIVSNLNAEQYYLEEVNKSVWQTAYRLLILEGKNFKLENRDSLLYSAFVDTFKADIVVMEPPMGLKFGADIRRQLADASFIKVPTGSSVSASAGDSLWIQQALSKLDDNGKAYILLPQGMLFRGGYDAKVREYLLENELVEAVIGLPTGILDFTSIAPIILILNKHKPTGSPVIFVDASEIGTRNNNNTEFSNGDAKLISDLINGRNPEDKRYKEVMIPEIREQNNELSISRYIIKKVEIEELDIAQEMNQLHLLQKKYDKSQQKLTSILTKFQ